MRSDVLLFRTVISCTCTCSLMQPAPPTKMKGIDTARQMTMYMHKT